MMELKEGMYVRTKDGLIAKCTDILEDCSYDFDNAIYGNEDELRFCEIPYNEIDNLIVKGDIIIKDDILDLIGIEDIITFKNDDDVYKVICVPNEEYALEVFYLAKNYDGETEDIIVYKDDMRKYIDRILTKEKFKKDSYEVK